jgi:hypothetical protein
VRRGGSGSWPRAAAACATLLLALAPAAARAQSAAAPAAGGTTPEEIGLAKIFEVVPHAISLVLEKGHAELFRLIENIELLDMETEIDRYVANPRDLNDATSYKLSLLPFHIRYPIYREVVDQMTRLDSVRSRRIHTVTPESVRLLDLRIQPLESLDEFRGEGAGAEVERSLLTHFSARELADLSVFMFAQQPFFPETDAEWQRLKRRIARGTVPLALGALATGAAFDAGAFSYSGNVVRRGDSFRLRWYGGFRSLGVRLHPHVRSGLSLAVGAFEAAAGIADQIRPAANQPDQALELALREGWLNQLARPLGWDAFFEGALRRSLSEPAGFTGELTATRGGFFFKRDRVPALPNVALRGSAEVESNLGRRLHLTGALGLEHSRSGIATMIQASHVAAADPLGVDDDRLTAFVAGTMEPISGLFAADMQASARLVAVDWQGLLGVEERREAWERRLLARGAQNRSPAQAQNDLQELAQMIAERDGRLLRLGSLLADYLDSRRRAYGILGWNRAKDDLHGPLDAGVLVGVRHRVQDRLAVLAKDLEGAKARLDPMQKRIAELEGQILALEARGPGAGPVLAQSRQALQAVRKDWNDEVQALRHRLDGYDQLRQRVERIAAASGPAGKGLRQPDPLPPLVRRRITWISFSAPQ